MESEKLNHLKSFKKEMGEKWEGKSTENHRKSLREDK